MDLVLRAYRLSFEHAWDVNCVSISRDEFRQKYNGNRQRISYVKTRILASPHKGYSMAQGITKLYQLQPFVREAVEAMDRKLIQERANGTGSTAVIKDNNNNRVKRITATVKKDVRSGSISEVPAWCPVNIPALIETADALTKTIDCLDGKCKQPQALREELEAISIKIKHNNDKKKSGRSNKAIMRDYLTGALNEVAGIIELASSANHNGEMPHSYKQSPAGRFYATGPVNLQNCTKLARNAAMSGFYSFDIESCHHAIVLQVAQSMGIDCPNLANYVGDKDNVRKSIAKQIDAPVSSVKASLIAMIYGAGLNPFGAISKELTGSKLKLAMDLPEFIGLHNELRIVFEAMLEHSGGAKSGEVVNTLGLSEPHSKRRDDQRRLAAHLLQGIESQALQAALSVHTSAVLPLHDGWVCLTKESHADAEKAIAESTGFSLQVGEPELIELSGIPTTHNRH